MVGDVGHGSGRTTSIYRRLGEGGVRADERGWRPAVGRGGEGDSVNGILLGHPFTRTRRKLEDLIWRAVWIAFALAMPPIEPSVIHVHIHTYYAHLSKHTANMNARSYVCTRASSLHENAVHSFVRSLVRSFAYIFAHTETRAYVKIHSLHAYVCTGSRLCVLARARTYGFLHFMIYRAAFSGPQSVLKARRLIKEIIEDAK